LFIKLINLWFKDTIDESKASLKPKNTFEAGINHELAIDGAKKIGCSVVIIGGADLLAGNEHLTLGLMWQIIKLCLLSQVTKNLDLSRLRTEADEAIDKVPPEQMLLRWFNYHLKHAEHYRTVTNFTTDIQDSENYVVLLSQIAPNKISQQDAERAFREKDISRRAEMVLELADKLGCKKFVTAKDIVEGNPRLNLAFVATLFNEYPALGPTKEDLAVAKAGNLQRTLDETIRELRETKADKATLESELQRSKENYEQLSNELRNIAIKLAESHAENTSLNESKAELQRRLNDEETKRKNLETELDKANKEKANLAAALAAEKKNREEAEKQAANLKAQLDKLAKEFQEEKERAAKELHEQKEQNKALAAQLEATRLERDATQKKTRRNTT